MPQKISCPSDSRTAAAAVVAEQLRLILAEGKDIVIDLSSVETTDIGLVQVIEAARISAEAENLTLALAAPACDAVVTVLDEAGLLWAEEPGDLAFWHHRGEPA